MTNLFVPSSENNFEPYLLRKPALIFYTLILVFFNFFSYLLPYNIDKVSAHSINAQKLIELANDDREKVGLPKLRNSTELTSAAYAKANDMLKIQYWDHFGPNGETPWQFISDAGYEYVYAGENLAKGFTSNSGIHDAWMASPTHRDNILSGNYKEIGIAIVEGELLGEDTILVVQMFGNRTDEVDYATTPENRIESHLGAVEYTGKIKSIKIHSPQHGSVITEADGSIIGEIGWDLENCSTVNYYQVEAEEGGEILGSVKSNCKDWEIVMNKSWSEGEHAISARVVNQSEDLLAESVFYVDTKPPTITVKDIDIRRVIYDDKLIWQVTIHDSASDIESIQIVNGNRTDDFIKLNGEYIFNTEVIDREYVKIIASDEHGNTIHLDITELFSDYKGEDKAGAFASEIKNFILTVSIRHWTNSFVLLFVLVLILIEVYYYRKYGMLYRNAYTVFLLAIWWGLITAGIFIGFDGAISTGVNILNI